MQAISSERAPTAAFQKSLWSRVLARHWIPKLATGAALLFAGLLSYQQHQLASRRALALQVVELHEMTTTATIEVLQNFDAIQRLNQVARDPDHDLIAALK